jgi:hypothetical protein
LLFEDKIQDLETAKENAILQNKIRPTKPIVKTTFKPRSKVINTSSNNISGSQNLSNVVGNTSGNNNNIPKFNDIKSNRLDLNKLNSNKDNIINNGKFMN